MSIAPGAPFQPSSHAEQRASTTAAPADVGLARIFSLVAALAVALAGLYPYASPDTFGHLAQGRQIFELGRVPRLDTWSLLEPARRFYNYEWLSDLLSYVTEHWLGSGALTVVKVLVLAGATWLLSEIARRFAGARAQAWCALVLIAAIPASRNRFAERPHVLGLLFACLTLLLLLALSERGRTLAQRDTQRLLAGLLGLHVLWVNCHGSHLLGLVISGCFVLCVGEARRRLFAAVFTQIVASCVSPYGPWIAIDAVEHVSDPRYRALVSEWAPWTPDIRPWYLIAPALQAALIAVLGPLLARESRRRALLLLSALLAVLCFRSTRFVLNFLFLSAPVVAVGLAELSFAQRFMRTALRASFPCVLGLSAYGALNLPPRTLFGIGASTRGLPAATGAFLREKVAQPRVFGPLEDTWYLMNAVPAVRVYIDGRVPFYGADFVQRAARALADPAVFDEIARTSRINVVVLRYVWAEQAALLRHLLASHDWQVAVIENDHIAFVRRGSVSGLADLSPLVPNYRYEWVLQAPEERALVISAASSTLQHPGSSAYVAWVRALLSLRPALRAGGNDGLLWPRDEAERTRYRTALDSLLAEHEALDGLRNVAIIEALLATLLGECTRAHALLDEVAERSARDRTFLLTLAELSLREGKQGDIAGFLQQQGGTASGDGWVAALSSALDHPPSCNR